METVESVCKDCGNLFLRERKRGRPPTRCQSCRDLIIVDNMEALAQVDPETLYSGPPEKLLGDRDDLPVGAEAQCVICWRIFTSDSSCESHKDYRYSPPCKDPVSLGMIAKDRRGLPIWTKPSNRVFE